MKHILFEIIKQKPLSLNLSLDEMKKYPTHKHFLIEATKFTLIYKYAPAKNCDEEKYIDFLKEKFKKQYNAYSVTAGVLQNQIEK